jgi:signal peptidase I
MNAKTMSEILSAAGESAAGESRSPEAAGGSPEGPRGSPEANEGKGPAFGAITQELLTLAVKTGIIAFAAVLALTFPYGLHRNADADMKPAVKDGDLVLFCRFDKDYAAGDLLLLNFLGETQVRRVAAREGDTVDITENGLILNGALQGEQDIYEKTRRYAEGTNLPVTLGKGEIFVLGDARENATDSRVYGPVNTKDTLGAVIAVIRRRNL